MFSLILIESTLNQVVKLWLHRHAPGSRVGFSVVVNHNKIHEKCLHMGIFLRGLIYLLSNRLFK